jgi:hypothetical protein
LIVVTFCNHNSIYVASALNITNLGRLFKTKRKVASKVLERMYQTCAINPKATSIVLWERETHVPDDYALQAYAELDFGSRICMAAIADEYKLRLKEQPGKIVLQEAQ